jgi:hypothetical protein
MNGGSSPAQLVALSTEHGQLQGTPSVVLYAAVSHCSWSTVGWFKRAHPVSTCGSCTLDTHLMQPRDGQVVPAQVQHCHQRRSSHDHHQRVPAGSQKYGQGLLDGRDCLGS